VDHNPHGRLERGLSERLLNLSIVGSNPYWSVMLRVTKDDSFQNRRTNPRGLLAPAEFVGRGTAFFRRVWRSSMRPPFTGWHEAARAVREMHRQLRANSEPIGAAVRARFRVSRTRRNQASEQVRPNIRCREIGPADLDAIADLLTRGFAVRSREYWMCGLRRQSIRCVPEGFPRFGYMLDHEGKPVGVLLLIYTARHNGGDISIRCNLSSWYVEPAFRNYPPMLTMVAQRHKHVTYVNISPAHWTWRTIEAQGFRAYCRGLFYSFPALSCPAKGTRIEVVQHDAEVVDGLPEADVALLARHAAYGCLSLVCRGADGRCSPFILQPLRIRRIKVPAMQLIYCADVASYVDCIGAIGRFLLRRGQISVALDSNGRMNELVGFYRSSRHRRYFKGPQPPRLADLSDTELALYGP
jgi:hypothetical protein